MRRKNGITLIALVITIIVLLILAGVSISMVTGDNGIATKAELAKTETDRANAEEEQDLNDALDYINNNAPEEDDDESDGTGNTDTTENVTITFKPKSSSHYIISLTNIDGMIYAEELESYEMKVPVGTKIERLPKLRVSWTESHAAMFPIKEEDFNESDFGWYDITVEDIPCVGAIYSIDAYETESGETIDIDNYYATEDMTIIFYDD